MVDEADVEPPHTVDEVVWGYGDSTNETSRGLCSASGKTYDMWKFGATVVMPVELTADTRSHLHDIEDSFLAKLLAECLIPEHTFFRNYELTAHDVNEAMASIEEHELVAAKVVCNTYMRDWVRGLDWVEDGLDTSMAHWWTADVIFGDAVPFGSIYLLPPEEYLGPLSLVVDAHRVGDHFEETIGMAVFNGYAVARIELQPRVRFLDCVDAFSRS